MGRLRTFIRKKLLTIALIAVTSGVAGLLVAMGPPTNNSLVRKSATNTPDTTAGSQKPNVPEPSLLPPSNYGFSANELVWQDAARQAKQLDDMKAAGVDWVRIDMQWYTVQPHSADKYDWSVYDRVVDAINQHGLKVLPILDYAPAWAAAHGCKRSVHHKCAPADPEVFAVYAAAAVARYAPRGVTAWEIWNEPNSPRFWYPAVDVNAYASLLKAAYPAMKQVDPNATIIAAGLRTATADNDVSPPNFVQAMYNAGAQPYFDALGAHPYTYPDLPSNMMGWNGWVQMLQIHDIAVAQGDGAKKIWMTEVGAATGGAHPISESRQAQIAQEAVQLHSSYPWAGPLFWYNYQDSATNRSSDNFYGLLRANGTPKLAYDSFVAAIKDSEPVDKQELQDKTKGVIGLADLLSTTISWLGLKLPDRTF